MNSIHISHDFEAIGSFQIYNEVFKSFLNMSYYDNDKWTQINLGYDLGSEDEIFLCALVPEIDLKASALSESGGFIIDSFDTIKIMYVKRNEVQSAYDNGKKGINLGCRYT